MNKGNNYQPFLRVTTFSRNEVCGSGGWVCVGGSSAHVDVAVGIDVVPRRPIADPLRAREMHLVVPIRLKIPLNPPASHIVMRLESHTLEAPLVGGSKQLGVNRRLALVVPASVLLDERGGCKTHRALGLCGAKSEAGLDCKRRWLLRAAVRVDRWHGPDGFQPRDGARCGLAEGRWWPANRGEGSDLGRHRRGILVRTA